MKYGLPLAAIILIIGGIAAYSMMQSGAPMAEPTAPSEMQQKNTAQKNIQPNEAMKQEKPLGTIVETAVAAGSFKTLVAAVQAAGLVETLNGSGPFTVFAPTDEAFAKLPAGTVENLLKDKEALTKILTYHVVAGKVLAADVVKLSSAKTVQGQTVTISTTNGVKINDATVIKTDIETSNGVIHVIDSVLLPN